MNSLRGGLRSGYRLTTSPKDAAPSYTLLPSGRTPTGVAFLWGVGAAGALPTSWTIWRSYPNALAAQATQGTRVSLQIVAGVVAGGYAVTFYAIRATGFAVGPL